MPCKHFARDLRVAWFVRTNQAKVAQSKIEKICAESGKKKQVKN